MITFSNSSGHAPELGIELPHTHTHYRFTALLDFVRDYPAEAVPKSKTRKVKPI